MAGIHDALDDPKMEEWRAHMEKVFGLAEVVIAKQRHGATGKVKMKFDARLTKFSDAADDNYLPEMRS